MAIPMGIGPLGFNNVIFKRKFRWTLTIRDICGSRFVPPHYVKLAARPNLSVEETEINHLNAKTWIPGKAAWETITVTYYDIATNVQKPLFDWLATIYDFTDPVTLHQASMRVDYAGTGVLELYDGCGEKLETWLMGDMWPTAINFGELDYSSSEECTIELTLRYSQVAYRSDCPPFVPEPCCTDCPTGISGGGVLRDTGSNSG